MMRYVSMKAILNKWTKELLADLEDDIAGWSVAIVGNVRSAWLDAEGEITRSEVEAFQTSEKSLASALMSAWYDRDIVLWRYMRLIPVSKTKLAFAPFHGLPTYMGRKI